MNRADRRRWQQHNKKRGDLNRGSTHKMRTKMQMGTKVETRKAIEAKILGNKEATSESTRAD